MGSCLFQAGGGQIHRNAAYRKFHAAALHRRTNPLPGLLYGGIGQAHNVEARHPVGDKGLRRDHTALNAADAHGSDAANHFPMPPFLSIDQFTAFWPKIQSFFQENPFQYRGFPRP